MDSPTPAPTRIRALGSGVAVTVIVPVPLRKGEKLPTLSANPVLSEGPGAAGGTRLIVNVDPGAGGKAVAAVTGTIARSFGVASTVTPNPSAAKSMPTKRSLVPLTEFAVPS